MVVWLSAYPSIERWILLWLCALPLVRGCIRLREELCTPGCSCHKSSVEVPCVGVMCGQASGLEILLCEGGDVEQWLEPRNKSWYLRLIH